MPTSFEPGAPIDGFIPLCVPQMSGREMEYVRECFETNFVSSVGPFVDRFERELAARVRTHHAVATTTGTAALHVALLVAGVEPEDEVLVSTLTFIAPVNAIRYVGAWPVFVDADPTYWQMDVGKLADFIARRCQWRDGHLWNAETGRRIRAVLPVHILGHPVDLAPVQDLARQYGLAMVEDATESLGGLYRDVQLGSFGDLACFSFNGNKTLTTGGGGMIVTRDESMARRARYLTTQAKDDPVEFVHGALGFNYRLTNVQAAIGCAQLEKLDEYVAAKRRIAARYKAAIAKWPGITIMGEAPWARSTYWLSTILVDPLRTGIGSRDLLRQLEAASIQTRPLWQPAHLSPVHRGAIATDCSVAEFLNRHALSLPSSVGLTDAEQDRVIDVLAASLPSVGARR